MASVDTTPPPEGRATPPLIYGTAWKEVRTATLVLAALRAGFRGIDTANQRKHYHEAGVGEALRAAFREGLVRRENLFLQTKFTFARGQDHRLPYDPEAPIATQVQQSLDSSLEHLGVDYVDSLVLHGPSVPRGLAHADWEAWSAMEELHRSGRARNLGISNTMQGQLQELHAKARVAPSIVQHRTLLYPHADADTRAFCRAQGIAYQGFSLLTAAPELLSHPAVDTAATRLRVSPAQVVLRYWLEAGAVVLTGTTSTVHMADDLAITKIALEPKENEAIAQLLESG
ncbi:MAG: aldo/keto reductase family protein [Thermoplasmatota archaeon]